MTDWWWNGAGVGRDLTDKVIFEQTLKEKKGLWAMWVAERRVFLGELSSSVKSFKLGWLTSMSENMRASMASAKGARVRVVKVHSRSPLH